MRSALMVGLDGVEPSTSRLSGVRSNRTELQAPVFSVSVRAPKCRRPDPESRLSLSPIQLQRAKLNLSKLNSDVLGVGIGDLFSQMC
jgi:hypothetical protein